MILYNDPIAELYSTCRFETGMGLYEAVGIERKDREGGFKQLLENFRFD